MVVVVVVVVIDADGRMDCDHERELDEVFMKIPN